MTSAVTMCSDPHLPTRLSCALLLFAVAAHAPAQAITYISRTGSTMVRCGPPSTGTLIQHAFPTPIATNDTIGVGDPGGASWGATAANAHLEANATAAGISLAVSGDAMRQGPFVGGAYAIADSRDTWNFTVAAPTRFVITGILDASSTQALLPVQDITLGAYPGGVIVPDPGSPSGPIFVTINTPGVATLTASGTLLPGQYYARLFGAAEEGSGLPFVSSFAHSLTIAFEPAATATARTAFGNPNSYTCGLPVLGQTWNAAVDVGSTGAAFAIVFAADSPANVPLGPGFTVLVGGTIAELLPLAAGPIASYAVAMPAVATLAGLQLSTQAVHIGGTPTLALSNAQDLTLGF